MINTEAQSSLYIATLEKELEHYCNTLFEDESQVGAAVRYSLLNGGKHVRGVLTLAVCEMLTASYIKALPLACAVEMIHSYSLIHDDLPCMDNDDMRRGKPSCHIVFGETNALLAGDALLTAAFEVASNSGDISAIRHLSLMAGARGMIYGQELDLKYENLTISETQLRVIHENKTGRMINAAVTLGAIAAQATEEQTNRLSEYAYSIGLAFQIIDDVLDVTSSAHELGKPIGSDRENNKCTFVTLKGVDGSIQIANSLTAKAHEIIKGFDDSDFLQLFTDELLNRKK